MCDVYRKIVACFVSKYKINLISCDMSINSFNLSQLSLVEIKYKYIKKVF